MNRRMPNGTYGGVRGWKTKVGRKLLSFPPTRFSTLCRAEPPQDSGRCPSRRCECRRQQFCRADGQRQGNSRCATQRSSRERGSGMTTTSRLPDLDGGSGTCR